jgi:hypothetical protein
VLEDMKKRGKEGNTYTYIHIYIYIYKGKNMEEYVEKK